MYTWTNEKLRWMMNATRYTTLYSDIAMLIEDIISPNTELCDAGCGTGGLSIALSPKVQHITAVDADPRVIEQLQSSIRKLAIDNVTPLCADIFSETPITVQPFDTMVFCRFGHLPEILSTADRSHCGQVIIIKQKNHRHRFDFQQSQNERNSYNELLQQLDSAGIPYQERIGIVESGQPFTSLEDARAFFAAYDKSGIQQDLSDKQLMERIIPTENQDFPYLLPAQAELGVLTCSLVTAQKVDIE